MDQALLSRMSNLLDSDGINYSVFLRAFSCVARGANEVENVVKELVGNDAVVADVRDCSFAEVTQELNDCLGYIGDEGAGPGPDTLRLPEFSNLLKELYDDLAQVGKRSNGVKSFRFLKGHPAYPDFGSLHFSSLGMKCMN